MFAAFKEEHPGEPYVLALVDVDDFKGANDQFGHTAGDKALQAIAQTMRQVFAEDAILSRMGGDEFQVVLTGSSAARADELIERFVAENLDYDHEGEQRLITTSVGYASYPDQAESRKELYSKADIALYAVKHAGKSACRKYDPDE